MRSSLGMLLSAVLMSACGPQDARVGGGGEEELEAAAGKIVGGTDANIAAFPYQVAIMDSSFFQFCGGTIVNASWVVTAQHCVEGTTASRLRVGAGSSRLSTMRTTGQIRSVSQIVRFPGYQMPERGKDIALLKLATPLDLSGPNAKAIAVAAAGDSISTGAAVVVSGWGDTSAGGSSPDLLKAATVNVVSQSTLTSQYGSTITSDQLGAAASGRDSCQGDSGGPLVGTVGGVKKLVGVVSWGNGCADPRFAGIYARVTSFESWINQNTGGTTAPPPPPPPDTTIYVDQSNVSASTGSWARGSFTVPAGTQSLTVVIQGGTGDADLYVRAGTAPTTSAYNCRPYTDGNNETCTFQNPQAGTWHIGIRAYQAFSGLSVRATNP
ncbi:MAG: trypsin-like serine protease [Myxococcaceae bacterium]|nr:trypsin-like serine protease [Myxococcaceae bacterium]